MIISFALIWLILSQLLVLLCLTKTSKALGLSSKQYTALQALYDSTNGSNWRYPPRATRWDFSDASSDPCEDSWSGVVCRDSPLAASNEVIQLDLSHHHLGGHLPDEFAANMTSLEVLNLEL